MARNLVALRGGSDADPRVARSRLRVLRAALEELASVGYGRFAIESVATRSGVAKSTIYRHWKGKLPLIAEAFETLNEQPAAPSEGGTPRERIQRLVQHVAEVMLDSPFSACVPALVEASERDPHVRAFHYGYNDGRRQRLIDAIAEGIAAGDFPPDLDPETAALALVGPIFYRRLMTAERFDPADAAQLVGLVLG